MSVMGQGLDAKMARWRWRLALMVFIVACFTASGARADYPGVSKEIPARPNGYIVMNRPHGKDFIDSIMIHDTEGRYAATVDAFTNPLAATSVHYVVSGEVNSSDPAVTQFVADKNGTKQVNNFWFNQYSIGVEHIGFAVAPAGYFTQELYERSADLVGWVVWRYHIPWTALTSSGTTTSRTPWARSTYSTGIPARRGTGRTTWLSFGRRMSAGRTTRRFRPRRSPRDIENAIRGSA
jgi:hypothetical protein